MINDLEHKKQELDPQKSVMDINQCDGCCRGLPVVNGIHRGPSGFWGGDMQYCTKYLYQK